MKDRIIKLMFLGLAGAFFVVPWCVPGVRDHAPGVAVILGIIFAVTLGNPFRHITSKLSSTLLGVAIVGLGFGMNIVEVFRAGASGFVFTAAGIIIGIGLGIFLGRKIGLTHDSMYLISIGTSICGGSAIAAAAPVLKARAHDVAIASAVVFTLNAVALLVFPPIGRALGFSQEQFGYWAALGIHDTSSVVGACYQYGAEALEVGTTIKLARALWIVPVTLWLSWIIARKSTSETSERKFKVKIPWFIPGFLGASAIVTFIPFVEPAGGFLKEMSKYLMITTLFIIGANLDRAKLKELGVRPVIHGVVLWIVLSVVWCLAVYFNVI